EKAVVLLKVYWLKVRSRWRLMRSAKLKPNLMACLLRMRLTLSLPLGTLSVNWSPALLEAPRAAIPGIRMAGPVPPEGPAKCWLLRNGQEKRSSFRKWSLTVVVSCPAITCARSRKSDAVLLVLIPPTCVLKGKLFLK